MAILVPFASGKGGVGKTVTAANLALLLARQGKTTILADMDWGGANAHTVLGLRNTRQGLGAWISEGGCEVADLVVPLSQSHLFFIPGDGLVPGTANMPFFRKRRLLKELNALQADYVIMDLGAGTSFNTVDLFLSSPAGFVVTTPEPTAILNAYSFIKTCLFRLLNSTVPAKSAARLGINEFFRSGQEFSDSNHPRLDLDACLARLAGASGDQAAAIRRAWDSFLPGIIINMGKDIDELRLGARLRQICRRHLGTELEYLGFLPWDPAVRQSVMQRRPLVESTPDTPWASALEQVCHHICSNQARRPPLDLQDQSDLENLGGRFLELAVQA